MIRYSVILLVTIAVTVTMSCEKDSTNTSSDKAYLSVHLTDTPADYEAVLIDIQDVLINRSDDDEGWTSLEIIEKGIYNLLDLTGGVDTLIASSIIDTGMVSQIRLILGKNNSIVIEGDTTDLRTPSAQQSGLKIKINQRLVAGISYNIILDFDAARSVNKAGNSGKYNLKPVIRTIIETRNGGISGSITGSIKAIVYAIQDTDSIGSFTDSTGYFFIQGLDEAIYSLAINPEEGWKDTTLQKVSVIKGYVTELGNIELIKD